jgi:hypothetical protein
MPASSFYDFYELAFKRSDLDRAVLVLYVLILI